MPKSLEKLEKNPKKMSKWEKEWLRQNPSLREENEKLLGKVVELPNGTFLHIYMERFSIYTWKMLTSWRQNFLRQAGKYAEMKVVI